MYEGNTLATQLIRKHAIEQMQAKYVSQRAFDDWQKEVNSSDSENLRKLQVTQL